MTVAEGEDWVRPFGGVSLLDPNGTFPPDAPTYGIEDRAGHQTHLTRQISVVCVLPAMLCIHEYGIWTDAGMPIYDLVRRGLGEEGPLHEAPAHLFLEGEQDALFSILCLTIYFAWGAVLIEDAGTRTWLVSHDECISVHASNRKKLREATGLLNHFELKRWN